VPFFLWLKNVFWRTLCAFVPTLAKPDDAFAKQHLSSLEYGLYLLMDARDRDHACQVAKALLERQPEVTKWLVRAALLHDIGKAEGVYHPLERIFVHLCAPKVAQEPRLKGLKGAWQRKWHHPYYGAEMLRQAGGCEKVAMLIERHHNPDGLNEAELLKKIEEIY
jgi:putative nucleotidyltransferase with HDIG domain